jgi:hypothetical protein
MGRFWGRPYHRWSHWAQRSQHLIYFCVSGFSSILLEHRHSPGEDAMVWEVYRMHIMCPPHSLKLRTFKYALLFSPPQNCEAPIMLHLAVSAKSSTQSSIINHGNHLWSCEKVSSRHLPNISRPFSRFQTSDTSRSALRRLPSSCSIHLEPRKSSCWHSKLRSWYIPIFVLRSKYDTPPTPWHKFMGMVSSGRRPIYLLQLINRIWIYSY